MRFGLGDLHSNAPNVRDVCRRGGGILITPRYGPYLHPDAGAEVRRVFHTLRSASLEPFDELFKGTFDVHGAVPTKGPAERREAERALAEARRVRATAEHLAAQAFTDELRARAAEHVARSRAAELACAEVLMPSFDPALELELIEPSPMSRWSACPTRSGASRWPRSSGRRRGQSRCTMSTNFKPAFSRTRREAALTSMVNANARDPSVA